MVTIIGAGLSGLATAFRLQQANLPFTIIEGNPYAGGRVQPALMAGHAEHSGHQDLGPSWVWPYAQPVIEQWLEELHINTFDQYDSGDALIDRSPDSNAVAQFLPGQNGIARIEGGVHAVVRSLLEQLPDVYYQHEAINCSFNEGDIGIEARVNGASKLISSDRLVIATPPRLAVPLISTTPELKNVVEVLSQTPTWMAPHAKVVMFYEHAFWREQGLSGRVASQVGPLVEIHDHCGPEGSAAALFGFSGVPAEQRAIAGDGFIDAVQQQLRRCFGEDAPAPTQIIIKDWALEKFVSTEVDITGSGAHPTVINELVRGQLCNNRLWFAASETSQYSPGLIEGALARADQVAEQIIASF